MWDVTVRDQNLRIHTIIFCQADGVNQRGLDILLRELETVVHVPWGLNFTTSGSGNLLNSVRVKFLEKSWRTVSDFRAIAASFLDMDESSVEGRGGDANFPYAAELLQAEKNRIKSQVLTQNLEKHMCKMKKRSVQDLQSSLSVKYCREWID